MVRVEGIPILWQRGKTETRFEPLRGILVGATAGGVFLMSFVVFQNKTLALLLGLGASLVATQSAYEIGLRRFLGEAGDVTVLLALLIKLQCLLILPVALIPSVLISAQAFSRYSVSSLHPASSRNYILMTALGMVPLLFVGNLAFLLLVPFLWLARNMYIGWLIRTRGGFNRHSLAATQQIIEIMCYLFVILSLHITSKFNW
jgi:cobalamin synthase